MTQVPKDPPPKKHTDNALPIQEPYEKNDLTYNDYLRVPGLLDLQHCTAQPPHHDEMLFIIIHQTYELWFKLLLHELEKAMQLMPEQKLLQANHFLRRVVEILRLLVPQIHILETMTPADFLQFREQLRPASGFQSMQFRELEYLIGLKEPGYLRFFQNRPDLQKKLEQRLEEPSLRDVYYATLRGLGFSLPADLSLKNLKQDQTQREQLLRALLPIYHNPHDNHPLYLVTESLVDIDENIGIWREHHVRVVSRIIGAKTGTGGSTGVDYLRRTTKKQCFPYLWEVRSLL